jgi:EmrB/QacA subfamily drug resistance transporter
MSDLPDQTVRERTAHHQRRWIALLILSLSLTLVIMDATIVNVAIPSIVEDFEGATFRDAEWVNTIYSLVYAATLILWGKIGDQYGRRLLFLIGVVLFGLGSALVGASSTIGMLVAMRAVQGVGAAILSPSTLSIVTTTFKGKERGIAFGIWGATAGVAAALGPLVGGWVIDHASWRWAFYINIPIVTAAFFGAIWAIRESRDTTTRHHFDVPGTLLGGFGLGALVFGIIEAQEYGWWEPTSQFRVLGWEWPLESISIAPVSMVGGAVLLALFAWYELRLERRDREPLFEFGLLRYTSFRYGMITGLIVNLGEIALLFAVSLFLQGTKGLTAFETGVALLPLAILAFFGAPLAGAFSARIGPKWIVTAGMVIEAAMLLTLSQIIDPDISTDTVALVLGVYGLGLGLAIAQLTSLVLFDIPQAKAGIASGANSTIRQVGAALGIAIIGTVLATTNEAIVEDETDANATLEPVFAMLAPQEQAAAMPGQPTGAADVPSGGHGAPPGGGMPDFGGDDPQDMMIELAKQPVYFEFEVMFQGTRQELVSEGEALIAQGQQMVAQGADAGDPALIGQGQALIEQGQALVERGAALPAQGAELDRIFNRSRSEAMANAAFAAFVFVALGALSSLMLPNPKADDAGDAGESAAVAAH